MKVPKKWRVHSWQMKSYLLLWLLEGRADILIIPATPLFIGQSGQGGWVKVEQLSVWVFVVKEIFTDVWRTKTHLVYCVFIAYVVRWRLHTTLKSVSGLLLFFEQGHPVSTVKSFATCVEVVNVWVMVGCHFFVARSVIPSLVVLSKTGLIWRSRWFWLYFKSLRLITKSKGLTLLFRSILETWTSGEKVAQTEKAVNSYWNDRDGRQKTGL